MRTLTYLFVCMFCIAAASAATPSTKEVECAMKMKALLEFTGSEAVDSAPFQRAVLAKAKALGDREKVVGWICDSSAKKGIPFIMDFAGGDFILTITKVEDSRIFIAHVQIRFDSNKKPVALYSRIQDQGPL